MATCSARTSPFPPPPSPFATVTLDSLIPVLQIAVGPVILISGIGLLLLSMTNRLGRTVDRSRELIEVRRNGPQIDRPRIQSQIDILWQRAKIMRTAISLAAIAALLAATLMIVLFLGVLLHLQIALALVLIFIGCLSAVIASLLNLIRDINLSLLALSLELEA